MKKYTDEIKRLHDCEVIPFCETVSVVIDVDGKDKNFPEDVTLQSRTIIGLIANIQDSAGNGHNQNGIKLLSVARAADAYLELWEENKQNVITVPLRELLSSNLKTKYFKIFQKGFSAVKSKITFGNVTTAEEAQAIDLVFICAD